MFNHVDEPDLVERRAFHRPGKLIQVPHNVGGGPRQTVDTHRSRKLFYPAPDIEYLFGH
jgi:hypothetical protein